MRLGSESPKGSSLVAVRPTVRTDTTAAIEPSRGSEYPALLRQVKAAGLLDRSARYYIVKMIVTGGRFLAGWVAFIRLGDSWWQLIVAAFLAFVFTQLGFIGHDAGHRQIFRSGGANYLVGLLHTNLAMDSAGLVGGQAQPPPRQPERRGP